VRALELPDLGAYAGWIESRPREVDDLLKVFSIKVTQFFRNPSFFRFLDMRVLAPLLERPRRAPLAILSAGCATGEEAYSIAMLLASRDPGGESKILATDLDRSAMAIARAARYTKARARHIPSHLASRFLERVSASHVQVAAEAARRVHFSVRDLFSTPRRPSYDLILCRNVLIYVDPERQMDLLQRFDRALRPGGYLALGRAERITGAARETLVTVNATERVYRRA